MGDIVRLSERRAARRTPSARREPRAEFFFDLACPFSYLVAERVDRGLKHVTWTPASATALHRGSPAGDAAWAEVVRGAAERRARELRMPLVWPERYPADVPAAMRAASYAAEAGRSAAFVLAAGRLAYCGGFDLEDPETLAEAAAAAGLPLDGCLEAAGHAGRDGRIEGAGQRLLAAGADRLPALRMGRSLVWGERKVGEGAAHARLPVRARVV